VADAGKGAIKILEEGRRVDFIVTGQTMLTGLELVWAIDKINVSFPVILATTIRIFPVHIPRICNS
jgi:transketolase C-terminal domain/subunit